MLNLFYIIQTIEFFSEKTNKCNKFAFMKVYKKQNCLICVNKLLYSQDMLVSISNSKITK